MISIQTIKGGRSRAAAIGTYLGGGTGTAEYYLGDGSPKIYEHIPPTPELNLPYDSVERAVERERQLIAHFSSHRRAGYDITYSAGKDISILAAIVDSGVESEGGKKEKENIIRSIVREEVSRMVEDIQQLVYTRTYDENGNRVRAKGEAYIGVYEHTTSRELDPQLHYHIYVGNRVRREDGKLTAIDASEIYRQNRRLLVETNYRIAQRLRSIGLKVARLDGSATISVFGVFGDPQLIERFSRRKRQIIQAAQERYGTTDLTELTRSQIKELVIATRRSKTSVDEEEIRSVWEAELWEHLEEKGIDPEEWIATWMETDPQTAPKYLSPEREQEMMRTALKSAIEYLDEYEGAFPRDHLWRNFLIALSGEGEGEELPPIERAKEFFEAAIHDPEYGLHIEGDRIETHEYRKIRQETQNILRDMMNTRIGSWSDNKKEEIIKAYEEEKGFKLSDDQRQALEVMLSGSGAVAAVEGHAGTGKTTVMEVFRRVVGDSVDIVGLAPSGKAADELAATLGRGQTIDSFLLELEKNQSQTPQKPPQKPMVIVIDEAGMVDTRKLYRLLILTRLQEQGRQERQEQGRQIKIILQGDRKQLKPVGAGDPFSDLISTIENENNGNVYAKLTAIRRQKSEKYRELTTALSERRWEDAVSLIADTEEPFSIPAADEIKKKADEIVKDKFISYEEALREAREELIADRVCSDFLSSLSSNSKTIVVTQTNSLREKINIRIREELKRQGLLGGQQIVVETKQKINPSKVGRPRKNEDEEYRRVKKEFAVGDRVILTKNDRRHGVKNGEIYHIERISGHKMILKNKKKEVEIDVREYPYIDHAYAITTHKSQGMSIDRVLIADPHISMDAHSFYVALTRGKQEYRIYTPDPVLTLYRALKTEEDTEVTPEEIARILAREKEEYLQLALDYGYLEEDLEEELELDKQKPEQEPPEPKTRGEGPEEPEENLDDYSPSPM